MAILKDLIVHGSSRFLNKIYASEIQTPLIDAEAGIFKKLKADDATIVGLLDVQGQMHTNSWTNSNIATIDGSFYITPTLSSSSGTVSFSSATAATFTGSYAAVSSLYIGNDTANTVQWTSGSKILITGEVEVDGEWTPLGTLLGTLNSTNPTTSMPIVNITDNRNNTSNILTNIYSLKSNDSLSYRNLKISLYQRADNSEYYPLGIFMTALGQNGKTFLDIYGGVNELTTSYGGYANPNVRIGNLSGLPAITTSAGNFSPVGWGIYTTNGYFSGTIISNTGVIGGWKLGASSLYNGTTGLNNNTEGIYLGTDGIRNYKDSTHFVTIQNGVINARGVNLTGKITATQGEIGGINIIDGDLDVSSIDIEDLNGASNYALKTEVTDAEKVATSYITYIDSTEGIKIHNVSDQTNYLKLNSSAISMYRNNIETLNINNNEVRIGKNSGNNVYIDNDSIDIKNGQTILATFGEAMQIGQNNKNHATINPLSFKLIDKEGNTYFHVSDLRENQNGTVEIVDTFISNGSNPTHSTDDGGYVSTLKKYSLSFPATDTNYTVEVSDSSGEGLSKTHYFISFARNANEGAIITVTYETSSYLVKAYTLGFRLENSKIGALSCGIGDHITASGISSYAEGYRTIASGKDSHAEGTSTRAGGSSSHAEGTSTTASGYWSHAEGRKTTASGDGSHAEGYQTAASGDYSHTEGRETTASEQFSHAEGYNSIASGISSHSEGGGTTASGQFSHAEGQGSIASGGISHAEGQNSVASGWLSHAEGAGTIASSNYQHVQGKYNIEDLNNRYAFIIGNGRQEPNTIVRSNAFAIDWNGSIEAAGDITANNLSINKINKIITGNYNIEDTNNEYAFIVGNGTSSDERSNSFTVDWNGNVEIAGDLEVTGNLMANNFGGNYLPSGRNINNLSKYDTGWWGYARSEVDGTFPVSDTYGTICHIQGTSDNVAIQFLRSNTQGATNPIFYTRYKIGGTWGAWQRYVSANTTYLTITRIDNRYCTAQDISYLLAYKKGGFLSLLGNLHVSNASTSNVSETNIASISGWNGIPATMTLPGQWSPSGSRPLFVSVRANGLISIGAYSGLLAADWYRFFLTVPCFDGYE